MPEEVVSKASVWGDDTVEVPGMDDFEKLQKKLKALSSDLAQKASSDIVKDTKSDLVKKISDLKTIVSSFEKKITTELKEGKWKEIFHGEIEEMLRRTENRYEEINSELDQKLCKLTECSIMAENIEQVFIKHEQEMKTIVNRCGETLIHDLQSENTEHFSLNLKRLSDAAKQITWQ